MITEEQYLEAKIIVDAYKKQKKQYELSIILEEGIEILFWYSLHSGVKFPVRRCNFSDLRDVEGFSHVEPKDCLVVSKGEFAGNVILKKHGVIIKAYI
jgi:hypothetical protein